MLESRRDRQATHEAHGFRKLPGAPPGSAPAAVLSTCVGAITRRSALLSDQTGAGLVSFFPLDREILNSSLWADGSAGDLKVWLYLLLRADRQTGVVPDADPAIALHCGLDLDQVASTLARLEAPDKYSRTETKEGRRIERIHGRIRIVNYRKYMNKDYSTPRVQRWRERQKKRGVTVKRVTTVTKTTDTDTDTDTEPTKKDPSSPATEKLLSKVEGKTSSASELAPANPFHFVAYWKDADETHDFHVDIRPLKAFGKFMLSEAQSLGLQMTKDDLSRLFQRALVKFIATYSKRSGRNGKTRGSAIGPKRLTEELVGWIRSDLASVGNRQASQPKGRAQRIDEQSRRLTGK